MGGRGQPGRRAYVRAGDLVKDEFGSVGIVLETRREDGVPHVLVRFPTWGGWSVEWLFEVVNETR